MQQKVIAAIDAAVAGGPGVAPGPAAAPAPRRPVATHAAGTKRASAY
jgi:hypothetical protein